MTNILSILESKNSIKSFLIDSLASTSTIESIPNSINFTKFTKALIFVLFPPKTMTVVNITINANSVKKPKNWPKNVIAFLLFLCLTHSLPKNFLIFPLLCLKQS